MKAGAIILKPTRQILEISFFLLVGINFSCNHHGKEHKLNPNEYKEPLVKVNKMLVEYDKQEIDAFIKRHDWEMEETGTGLRYMIYQIAEGVPAQKDMIATINYRINLLNGKQCYSSGDLGPKEFRIGKGGVEAGLEEGILLMKVGEKAKFIMPPHLAHGLLGDENKIPPRATIVYDVELVSVK